MKISASFELLDEAISIVNANPIPPVLQDTYQYILIETTEDNQKIRLTKTDSEIYISSFVHAEVTEAGRLLIHGDNIAKILKTYRNLKKDDNCSVVIEGDANKVTLRFTDNKKYKPAVLPARDPDYFEELTPFANETASCSLIAAHLKDYVGKSLLAINKHESQMEHKGAYFKYDDKAIELTSSNRQEIALIRALPLSIRYTNNQRHAFALIPRKTLEAVTKIVKGEEPVFVSVAAGNIQFKGSNEGVEYEILTGILDVDSPLDASPLIPADSKNEILIPTQALKSAIAHMEAITDRNMHHRITILPDGEDAVALSCKSPCGEIPGLPVDAKIIKHDGSSPLIMNDQKLISILKALRSHQLRIKYNETGAVCTFHGEEEEYFTLIAGSLTAKDQEIATEIVADDGFSDVEYQDKSSIGNLDDLETQLEGIDDLEL